MLVVGTQTNFEPIVITSGEGVMPGELEAAGVTVDTLPLTTKWSFLANTLKLRRLIKSIQPQALHLHGHFAGSLGQFAVFLAGRPPTIYTVRWPAYSNDRNLPTAIINWLVEWFSCTAATVVVAVSAHDYATLVSRHICDSKKLKMIHNAFAPVPEARAAGAPTDGVVTIGFVGRLVDQKGCNDLISAIGILVGQGAPVRLMVVGDGPLRPQLEEQVRDLALTETVEFLGFRTDVPLLIAQMDVVAVPSIFEPFGIVAVEAMAHARPVVAASVGGLTETVEDGVTGRLVPPGDPRSLATALGDLVRSSATRTRMGEAARERALDRFSPEKMINAYSMLYKQLTEGVIRSETEDVIPSE